MCSVEAMQFLYTYICLYIYSGTSLYSGTIGTQLAVLYREVSLIQRYVDLHKGLCG